MLCYSLCKSFAISKQKTFLYLETYSFNESGNVEVQFTTEDLEEYSEQYIFQVEDKS